MIICAQCGIEILRRVPGAATDWYHIEHWKIFDHEPTPKWTFTKAEIIDQLRLGDGVAMAATKAQVADALEAAEARELALLAVIEKAIAAHKAGPGGFDKAHVGALAVFEILSQVDSSALDEWRAEAWNEGCISSHNAPDSERLVDKMEKNPHHKNGATGE